MADYPRYLALQRTGALAARAAEAVAALARCTLCPRACSVDRLKDARGFCRTGRRAVVSSAVPHLGEEPPISGRRGSGTIFFTHCNLACAFCQNYEISQLGQGEETDAAELAGLMLELQERGCHNINLVTPSHVAPQILEAVAQAADRGLRLPLVWNSSGYDGAATLALLDGVVDIYMPDMKYGRNEDAARLSDGADYADRAREALREMYRQVGDLACGDDDIAVRGLLVRHLVLPGDASGTRACLEFLAGELSTGIGLSLMAQYRPAFRATETPAMARTLSPAEYRRAMALVDALGFECAFVQRLESADDWVPDFEEEDPFKRWRDARE
jgi:putative pyruvate formate lyase activating enzyme